MVVFSKVKFVMSLVPLLPKLIAWNLDGLTWDGIWLILNHCNIEVQVLLQGVNECQNLSEHKTGCYHQHNCRERTYPKVKNIINKNIEKKRANNRALGYTSDDVSPLTVVMS